MEKSRKICADFCSFYRPGKNQDLACNGIVIVNRLIRKRRVSAPEKTADMARGEVGDPVKKRVCLPCPFYEDGCDFAAGVKESPPCGGVILLGQFLRTGIITVDDLTDME